MATIRKEIMIEAPAPYVWAALREAGTAEHCLGFAVDARLEGHAWEAMFSGAAAVRAILTAFDENLRRLACAVGRARSMQHKASFHVSSDGAARSLLVWTTDVGPDDAVPAIGDAIEGSAAVLKRALEGAPAV